jgi:hypothetical protein
VVDYCRRPAEEVDLLVCHWDCRQQVVVHLAEEVDYPVVALNPVVAGKDYPVVEEVVRSEAEHPASVCHQVQLVRYCLLPTLAWP